MRTDCFAHRCAPTSVRILTAAVRILTDVGAHLHRSDIQFRTDHSIPHRPNSSPLLTDVGAHAHRCAQMRTDVGAHPHRSIYNSSPTISYCALLSFRPPLLQPRPIFTVFYGNKAYKLVIRSILITNIKYPTRYKTSQYITILNTVKPLKTATPWGMKKWTSYRGGRLIEVNLLTIHMVNLYLRNEKVAVLWRWPSKRVAV